MAIPAELMLSADRKMRIAELQKRLSRAWLQATALETVGIFLPAILVFILYLNDRISLEVVAPIMIVFGMLMGGFWVVFILKKAQPIQREIAELKRLEDTPPD